MHVSTSKNSTVKLIVTCTKKRTGKWGMLKGGS